jgi:hypothetical protein
MVERSWTGDSVGGTPTGATETVALLEKSLIIRRQRICAKKTGAGGGAL